MGILLKYLRLSQEDLEKPGQAESNSITSQRALIDHYLAVCMLMGLFILSVIGAGDVRVVSMLGLLLCVAGLAPEDGQGGFVDISSLCRLHAVQYGILLGCLWEYG